MTDSYFNAKAVGNIPLETLRTMYVSMLRIRKVEEKIAKLYPEQEMRCPTHLSIGQEAVAVGVCAALRRDDYIFSAHRSHAHYLAKGGDVKLMMAELYGKKTGCTKGKGGSMHLVQPDVGMMGATPIVAATIPIAAGMALASVMLQSDKISVAFFGDAAVEEGTFHETMNFASLRGLPMLFICENNFYSTATPLWKRQPADNIYERPQGYRMPGVRVYGNDVLAVFDAAREAVARARRGDGPTFIECRTYRWLEHVGPNFDYKLGYRTREEVEEWMVKCPVRSYEQLLSERKILSDADIAQIAEEINREVDDSVKFAKDSPFPDEADAFSDVY
jgi:pyruvate dehydrogenase E1 component alpha subunit